jgi:hypothetical protein
MARPRRWFSTLSWTMDWVNTSEAAAGYHFSLLLRWFEALLRALIATLLRPVLIPQPA